MKIRLYRPVAEYLLGFLGNNQSNWETQLSSWAGFPVRLPKFFWEVHLFVINKRSPSSLTVECNPEKNWFSVFYSYNLNGDLKKYMELTLVRKCRRQREEARRFNLRRAG